MQIYFDVGAHRKSINAALIPVGHTPIDIDTTGRGKLGIAVIAGYNGVKIQYIPWEQTERGFFEQAQYVANMVATFGVPYLLGQKSDWNDVCEYIAGKIEERTEGIKQYRFPQNVQKRWHLPPPTKQGSNEK
jgi:hypothetical protein